MSTYSNLNKLRVFLQLVIIAGCSFSVILNAANFTDPKGGDKSIPPLTNQSGVYQMYYYFNKNDSGKPISPIISTQPGTAFYPYKITVYWSMGGTGVLPTKSLNISIKMNGVELPKSGSFDRTSPVAFPLTNPSVYAKDIYFSIPSYIPNNGIVNFKIDNGSLPFPVPAFDRNGIPITFTLTQEPPVFYFPKTENNKIIPFVWSAPIGKILCSSVTVLSTTTKPWDRPIAIFATSGGANVPLYSTTISMPQKKIAPVFTAGSKTASVCFDQSFVDRKVTLTIYSVGNGGSGLLQTITVTQKGRYSSGWNN